MMRTFRLVWLFTVSLFVVSCSQNETHRSLKTAEDVINDNPDSTLSILRGVEYDALKEERLKALYGLLYTSAIYKKQEVLDNDSLIDHSIGFFENTGDSYHLADAYYYKGAMNFTRKELQISTYNLKKAEEIAIERGYNIIANKTYELLSFVNYVSENKDLTLEYTKKFQESSIKINDQSLIARASLMVASSYAGVNLLDSAYFYIIKGLQYIDSSDSLLRADILVNVGEMYFEKGELDSSADYALESDSIYSNPHAKMLLGKIEFQMGDTLKAKKYWDEALSIGGDVKLKKKLYKTLSNYYAKIGQYDSAFLIASQMDTLKEDMGTSSKAVLELQLQFNRAKSESELYKKIVYALVIAFLSSAALLVFLRYHRKKFRLYNGTINTLTDKNEELRKDASIYMQQIEENEKRIGLLKKRLGRYGKLVYFGSEKMESNLMLSPNYLKLKDIACSGKAIQENEWDIIRQLTSEYFPGYNDFLDSKVEVNSVEYRICSLLRLHFKTAEIANMLNVTPPYISKKSTEIMRNIFKKKGSSKELAKELQTF